MFQLLSVLERVNQKLPEPLQEANRTVYRKSVAVYRLISMSSQRRDRANRNKWKRLVEYIRRKPDQWLLLCSPQIGDTLLTCGLAKSFEETHRPGNIRVLVAPRLKVLTSYFPSIEQDKLTEIPEDLTHWPRMRYFRFRPDLWPGMPLRTSYEGLQETHGTSGVSLLDVLKFEMYLPSSAKLEKPLPIPRKELSAARDILAREKLPRGETVILSPMARGIRPFRMEWWQRLAKLIEGRGLVVVWNLSNDVEAHRLRVLYPPLNLMRAVSYLAGNAVSMRSGFCDLLACDDLHLVVLYPKGEKYHFDGLAVGSARDFYSLKAIWESESAVELELCRKEVDARLPHTFTPILNAL